MGLYLNEWELLWEDSFVVGTYIGIDDDSLFDDDDYTYDMDLFPRVASPLLTISSVESAYSRGWDDDDMLLMVYVRCPDTDEAHSIEIGMDGTVGDLKLAIKRHKDPTIPFSTRLHNLIHMDSDEILDNDDLALSDTEITGEDILMVRYKPEVSAYIQLKESGVGCRFSALSRCIAEHDMETLHLIHMSGIDVSNEPNTFSLAICHRNREASLYLLGAGADPNRTISDYFNRNIDFLIDILKEADALERIRKLDFRSYSVLCPYIKKTFQEKGIEDLILPDLSSDVLCTFNVESPVELSLVKKLLCRTTEAIHQKDSKNRNALLQLLIRGEGLPSDILDIALGDNAYTETDYRGRNCLHIACGTPSWMGCQSNIRYLLQQPELQHLLSHEDDSKKLPLTYCLKNKRTTDATCLLVLAKTLEAIPEVTKKALTSFLKTAVAAYKFSFCTELLKHGAPSDWENSDGRNVLHLMAGCSPHSFSCEPVVGEVALVDDLIKCGVDPNKYDNLGETPLSLSLERAHIGISSTLYKRATPQMLRKDAPILIERAARNGHFHIVTDLVRHKRLFDPQRNQTILKQVLESHRRSPDDVVKMFIEKGCLVNFNTNNPPLAIALRRSDIGAIKAILSHPELDLTWTNSKNQGYLHVALLRGPDHNHKARLEALIEAGIPLGVGDNPIAFAIKSRSRIPVEKCIAPLLKAVDFTPNWRDGDGRNYLHHLVRSSITTAAPYHLLLTAGVDPTARDNNGNDAISAAQKWVSCVPNRSKSSKMHIVNILEGKQKNNKGGKGKGVPQKVIMRSCTIGGKGSKNPGSGKGNKGSGKKGKKGKGAL